MENDFEGGWLKLELDEPIILSEAGASVLFDVSYNSISGGRGEGMLWWREMLDYRSIILDAYGENASQPSQPACEGEWRGGGEAFELRTNVIESARSAIAIIS